MNLKHFLKPVFVLSFALGCSLLCGGKVVYSQYYSQGGNNPSLVIDKKIRPINDSEFYDNISSTKKTFVEGDQIEFLLTVSNSGNIDLNNVKLIDYLPSYLTLIFYPGTYNSTDRETISSIELKAGEKKEYLIRARVSNVPVGSYGNLLKINNKACVSNDLASDCDNAYYFVSKNTTPSTGANNILLETVVTLFTCGVALGLRKVARGY